MRQADSGPAPAPRRLERQCAWCGRVQDASGRYGGPPGPRLANATHGICPPCRAPVDRQIADWHRVRAEFARELEALRAAATGPRCRHCGAPLKGRVAFCDATHRRAYDERLRAERAFVRRLTGRVDGM